MAMKTYTIEEIEDKYIGKKGTEKRNKYEKELREELQTIIIIKLMTFWSKTHAKYACLLYFQANYLEFPKKSHTFAPTNKPRWRNR